MPAPESDNVVGELTASLMNETLPVTAPAAEGLKVTLNEIDCPAASVSGRDSWEVLKPVPPVRMDSVMVTSAFPVLVRVTTWVSAAPTRMSPKLRLPGVKLKAPVKTVPVPVSGIVTGEFDASLLSKRLSVTVPAD